MNYMNKIYACPLFRWQETMMAQEITSYLHTSMWHRFTLFLAMEPNRVNKTFPSGFYIMNTCWLRITASEPSPRFQHMSKYMCVVCWLNKTEMNKSNNKTINTNLHRYLCVLSK